MACASPTCAIWEESRPAFRRPKILAVASHHVVLPAGDERMGREDDRTRPVHWIEPSEGGDRWPGWRNLSAFDGAAQ